MAKLQPGSQSLPSVLLLGRGLKWSQKIKCYVAHYYFNLILCITHHNSSTVRVTCLSVVSLSSMYSNFIKNGLGGLQVFWSKQSRSFTWNWLKNVYERHKYTVYNVPHIHPLKHMSSAAIQDALLSYTTLIGSGGTISGMTWSEGSLVSLYE